MPAEAFCRPACPPVTQNPAPPVLSRISPLETALRKWRPAVSLPAVKETLARAYRDGYRAAKDPDTSNVMPDFLAEPEPDLEQRSEAYALESIQHYGIKVPT